MERIAGDLKKGVKIFGACLPENGVQSFGEKVCTLQQKNNPSATAYLLLSPPCTPCNTDTLHYTTHQRLMTTHTKSQRCNGNATNRWSVPDSNQRPCAYTLRRVAVYNHTAMNQPCEVGIASYNYCCLLHGEFRG